MNKVDTKAKNSEGLTAQQITKCKEIIHLFEKYEEALEASGQEEEKQVDKTVEESIPEIEGEEDEEEKVSRKLSQETEYSHHEIIKEMIQHSKDSMTLVYVQKVHDNLEKFINFHLVGGFLGRVGKYYMTSKSRFFILNPVQGTLIKYKQESDYPNKPRQIFNLEDIDQISEVYDGFFMKNKHFYFSFLDVKETKHIFYTKNELALTSWMKHLNEAKVMYRWIRILTSQRYQIQDEAIAEILDKVLTAILNSKGQKITIQNEEGITSPYTSGESGESTEASKTTPISSIGEDGKPPPTKEEIVLQFDGEKKDKNLDVSEELLPNEEENVGFGSFEIIDALGQGTFGKVFKVRKKDNGMIYAMKVLKKSVLVRNKHLKYAITEANVLRQANHPYIIKLHYSFQTPDYLYMILDYCPGGDLSIHLNQR